MTVGKRLELEAEREKKEGPWTSQVKPFRVTAWSCFMSGIGHRRLHSEISKSWDAISLSICLAAARLNFLFTLIRKLTHVFSCFAGYLTVSSTAAGTGTPTPTSGSTGQRWLTPATTVTVSMTSEAAAAVHNANLNSFVGLTAVSLIALVIYWLFPGCPTVRQCSPLSLICWFCSILVLQKINVSSMLWQLSSYGTGI